MNKHVCANKVINNCGIEMMKKNNNQFIITLIKLKLKQRYNYLQQL